MFLLVNCHESSSLFGPLAPHLAASVVAHWGGNRIVPWPLVWDCWPSLSFALPDQPPPPDHCENHLIWVDSIQVIPLACCRMSLESLEEHVKFRLLSWHYHCNYGSKFVICIGVLKVSYLCKRRVYVDYFFSTETLSIMGYLTINTGQIGL
jgi:hypothetical protein